jgi:catechol 2,3-dioxygenase-like lactoylglutathione lyase family enzyme
MNIVYLELSSKDLPAQRDFYANILELPVTLDSAILELQAGRTILRFTQAPSEFMGAYHFAFNIPENQYESAKQWITSRVPLLRDKTGTEDFESKTWRSSSLYFLDSAGNVLEFIARHTLNNASNESFNSRQILNISEIGLPSENVIELANDLCTQLGVSVYKQEPNENVTPVGDENGLLILPAKDRIWMPDSGVPAKLLPVNVKGEANGREWEVRGVPYEIIV